MKLELIFMGAPASGKGTQTKMLVNELNLPHVDTGSMLRGAIASGSENGKLAKSFMDKGELVPIQVVVNIIKDRLTQEDCNGGFILDGFPRSVEQAQELDKILEEINATSPANIKVINIDVPFDILIDRIVNRKTCVDCGQIYNTKFFPSKVEDVCDKCGGKLNQRSDDNAEIAGSRMNTYKEQTFPLIEYYKEKGWLSNVNGNQDVKEIYSEIKEILSK